MKNPKFVLNCWFDLNFVVCIRLKIRRYILFMFFRLNLIKMRFCKVCFAVLMESCKFD
jgi:hypothetical protein